MIAWDSRERLAAKEPTHVVTVVPTGRVDSNALTDMLNIIAIAQAYFRIKRRDLIFGVFGGERQASMGSPQALTAAAAGRAVT